LFLEYVIIFANEKTGLGFLPPLKHLKIHQTKVPDEY
jgi:hypothetical protein